MSTIFQTEQKRRTFSFRDEILGVEPRLKLDLFLLISKDEIVSSFYSASKNKFLSLESFAFDEKTTDPSAVVSNFFRESDPGKRNINSARIIYETDHHTLLPEAFFREEDLNTIFDFNFTRQDGRIVLSNHVHCFDVRVLYGIPASLLSVCREFAPSPVYLPHVAGMMEAFHLHHRNVREPVLRLHLRKGSADVMVKKERQLLFSNVFTYRNPEEMLFHLLNVYEQLQLNPERELLVLSGMVDEDSEIFKLIYRYIRNVEFTERLTVAGYSYAMDEIPAHQYYHLFSQVCVS